MPTISAALRHTDSGRFGAKVRPHSLCCPSQPLAYPFIAELLRGHMPLGNQPGIRFAKCRTVDCHAVMQGSVKIEENRPLHRGAAEMRDGVLSPKGVPQNGTTNPNKISLFLLKNALCPFGCSYTTRHDNGSIHRFTHRSGIFAEVPFLFEPSPRYPQIPPEISNRSTPARSKILQAETASSRVAPPSV